MRKFFLTGMAILLPMAITFWIIDFFFNLLTKPFLSLAGSILDDFGIETVDHPIGLFFARVGILLFLFFFTMLLGYIAQKYFFKFILNSFQNFLKKIPIVKSVYQIVEQTTNSLIAEKKNPFSHVVTAQFPKSDSYTLAFLTGESSPIITKEKPDATEAVFIPTAPHPISGFLLFLPKTSITPIEMKSEDAFKILFSCGSYNPSDKNTS